MSMSVQEASKDAWDTIFGAEVNAQFGNKMCTYCAFEAHDAQKMMCHVMLNHRVLVQCDDCKILLEPQTMKLH